MLLAGAVRPIGVVHVAQDRSLRARGPLQRLSDAGFGVFSQTDEDGIISWLVDVLGISNESFVEFGVHDFRESNSRYLLMTRNWKGLVIDGDSENIAAIHSDGLSILYDFEAIARFVTRENIQDLIDSAGLTGRLGLLSTDIDGVDYWVLQRITSEADIIVVEFNDFLGEQPISVPYSPDFNRYSASPHGCYWGASLAAFRHLLERRGYLFVGTNRIGVNAFFVHGDHATAIRKNLAAIVHHPCRMREARDAKGRSAYKSYTAFADEVAHLPVVRVDTGETVKLGTVCRRS